MPINRDEFPEGQLIRVNHREYVILNSGGPLMKVLSIEDGIVLVEWQEGTKLNRHRFPIACLSRLVPFTGEDDGTKG